VEQQQESTGVSRGQNHLHVLPEDSAAAARALQPLLGRVDPLAAAIQVLVVTSDAEAAAGLAERLIDPDTPAMRVMAATEPRRSARVVRGTPPHVLVGAPQAIAELLRGSSVKLDAVRVVVLGWVDALEERAAAALETVMGEVPKDAARVVLASAADEAVEKLVERYAFKARRAQGATINPLPPVSLSYVVTTDAARPAALRRTLDALDPESAFIVVGDARSRVSVESLLRSLGYGVGGSESIRVGGAPEGPAELVVLYDLPHREEELRAIGTSHGAARVVALLAARQLPAARSLAGGAVTPLVLPDAAVRARSREDRLRDELRELLDGGQLSREVLSLEPLLANHDGIEIAAAALRLLEAERGKARLPQLQSAPATVTRLYINAGSMDEVRAGDLIGAITNQAGISKAELGRVEVRERHSTVEVSSSVANTVVSKLTGAEIRGRRIIARVDEDKPRPHRSSAGSDRGERRGGPRDRDGGRDRDRGKRPPRPREGAPRRDRP
jgi:ATP-dependent RNA helicase DeaD